MFTPNRDLFHRHQVPEHFQELFIDSGYRKPTSTIKECFFSVFKATNETLNFWTHFIPAVYFWYVTYTMITELNLLEDTYMWPLFAYMIGVCLFPITSAVAHVFNTMSDRARHICFFFDYVALSIFTMGASIAYKGYIFTEDMIGGIYHSIFLPVACVNAVVSLILCCQTRFMELGLKKKIMRISAFAIPYWFDSVPMIYRILFCSPQECQSRALAPHTYQFIFGFLAAALYISHVPERLFPGRFDIVGHSHQLFHVFTVIGCHLQVNAVTMDAIDRRELLLRHDALPTPNTSLFLMLSIIFIDAVVLIVYIYKIYHVHPSSQEYKNLYGEKKSSQLNGNYIFEKHSENNSLANGDHSKVE